MESDEESNSEDIYDNKSDSHLKEVKKETNRDGIHLILTPIQDRNNRLITKDANKDQENCRPRNRSILKQSESQPIRQIVTQESDPRLSQKLREPSVEQINDFHANHNGINMLFNRRSESRLVLNEGESRLEDKYLLLPMMAQNLRNRVEERRRIAALENRVRIEPAASFSLRRPIERSSSIWSFNNNLNLVSNHVKDNAFAMIEIEISDQT